MADIPLAYLTQTASVRTFQGSSGKGEQLYGAAATFACLVEHSRRRVRSSTTGQEVISSSTLRCRRSVTAAAFRPGSLVTMPSGDVAEVIDCKDWTGGGLPTPDHLEVILA